MTFEEETIALGLDPNNPYDMDDEELTELKQQFGEA